MVNFEEAHPRILQSVGNLQEKKQAKLVECCLLKIIHSALMSIKGFTFISVRIIFNVSGLSLEKFILLSYMGVIQGGSEHLQLPLTLIRIKVA